MAPDRQPSRWEEVAGQVRLCHFAFDDAKSWEPAVTEVLRIAHRAERDGWEAKRLLDELHEALTWEAAAVPEDFEKDEGATDE